MIKKRIISLFVACTLVFTTALTAFKPQVAHANVLALPTLALSGGGGELGAGALATMAGPAVLIVGGAIAGYYTYQNKDYLLYKAQQTWGYLDSATQTALEALANGVGDTVTLTKEMLDNIDRAYQQAVQGITQETVQLTTWNGLQLVRFAREGDGTYPMSYKTYSIGRAFSLSSATVFSVKEIEDGTLALYRDGVKINTDFDTNTFSLNGTAFNIYYRGGYDTVPLSSAKDYFIIPTISATSGRPGLTVLYEDPWTLGKYREFATVYPRDIYADSQTYTTPTTKTKDLAVATDGSVTLSKEDIRTTSLNPTAVNTNTGVDTGTGTGTATGTVSLDLSPLKSLGGVLTSKFPFSIPWDLSNAVQGLKATPKAPHWTITFPSNYFIGGGTIDIDFAQFQAWANIVRWGLLIAFNIGLIMLTRTIIRG